MLKHIVTYKLFEGIQSRVDMINTIDDICLELNDNGFTTDITQTPGDTNICELSIELNDNYTFNLSEIKDILFRIKKVIGSENILQEIYLPQFSNSWFYLSPAIDNDESMISVKIKFFNK